MERFTSLSKTVNPISSVVTFGVWLTIASNASTSPLICRTHHSRQQQASLFICKLHSSLEQIATHQSLPQPTHSNTNFPISGVSTGTSNMTYSYETIGSSHSSKESSLQPQKNVQHMGRTYNCGICDESSNNQLALEQHECMSPATTSGDEVCRQTIPSDEASPLHAQDTHLIELQRQKKRDNPQADFEVVLRLLERTLPNHQAKNDCKYCPRSFPTTTALHQHRCDSPTPETAPERETSHPSALSEIASPASTHATASIATFACKYCERLFPTTVTLHQHRCEPPTYGTTSDRKTSHQSTSTEHSLPASPITSDRSFSEHHLPAHALSSPWSLQPARHEEVAELIHPVLSVEFFEASGFDDCTKHHDTHIMGYFTCTNKACRKDNWSSRMIALTIRLYSGKRYNAVVWHQRCKKCQTFGQPTLEESYAERIAYRLKVWFGKPHETIDYFPGDPFPHKRWLCEGCKNGHCPIGALDKT